jgi:hypothetical protein
MAEQENRAVLRLASASPRRRQLLELIGVPHLVTPARYRRNTACIRKADEYVMRLAREKAAAIWAQHQDLPVLRPIPPWWWIGDPRQTESKPMLPHARQAVGTRALVHTGSALRACAGVHVVLPPPRSFAV